MKIIIGIDLGTTYSCVSVYRNGMTEIIANETGNRVMPSYVAFNETDILIGDAAKNQCATNPKNTIYDSKRFIGRKFDDPVVQADIKNYPFKIIDVNNKPHFEVTYKNEIKVYSPEEISSFVLLKLKQIASTYLGTEITDAVVTVPAYFNDSQRQSTKDAGRIAGLNVVRIINEPTAAALAYGLDKNSVNESKVFIFDCGGGTHDCTLLSLHDGVFRVLATSGDTRLGGEDFDNRLVEWCLADFKKKTGNDLHNNARAIRRLRTACEKIKRVLSTSSQATIDVESLFDGIDYSGTISRSKFEEICSDLFKKTIVPVEQALTDAKIDKNNVGEVVLVGGSTRIPKIKSLLSDYFNGKKLNESLHVDECVAAGASIEASILSGANDQKLDGLVLVDVSPLSLGLETAGGIMTNIIDRNTTIPCKKTKTFTTHSDNQNNVTIQIYEGERKFTVDNNKLGSFFLDGITPAPRGVPQIEVTFEIDANGILNVIAYDKGANKSKNITITNNRNRISDTDIERMVAEAKKFEADDLLKKQAIEARNQLENYIHSIKNALNNNFDKKDIEVVEELCAGVLNYVDSNPKETKEIYEQKRKEVEGIWNPIAVKMYSTNSQNSQKTPTSEQKSDE